LDKEKKILIYGYGNPGKQDDGLGIHLSEKIAHWIKDENIRSVKVDCNYQLNIEDVAEISDKDLVIFIDASKEDINEFLFTEVRPSNKPEFSMHAVSPSYIFNLCQLMYNKVPNTYLLHIKGYEWDFLKEMTEQAKSNLSKAYDFLRNFILNNEVFLENNY
jgi:hydrogenase maturation protease